MNKQERKKNLQKLKAYILRYRKQKKLDEVAIANFCYSQGIDRKIVEEWYDILLTSERISVPESQVFSPLPRSEG